MKSRKVLKVQFFIFSMLAVYFVMGFLYFSFNNFFLIFFPFIILSLISLPLVIRTKKDFFSIWSWIFYSSILGIFFRSLYIFFDIPDYNTIENVFLMGKSKSFLFSAMLLVFIGIFFLSLGYLSTNKKLVLKNKIFQSDLWEEKKFLRTSFFLMIISISGLILFINSQGGLFSIQSISGYRGVSDTLTGASPHGYLRLLVSFSGINLFLLTAWLIRYNSRKLLIYTLWLISFITFIFFNFYISQRGAIVFIFVQLIALNYYMNGFKIPKVKMIIGLIFALAIFQVMSTLRGAVNVENTNIKLSVSKALEPAILTTNMIDVSKTAHIINAIPNKIDFEYGATLVTVFIAWIPRELWPNKPVTNVDNTIGIKVFGANTYGSGAVPPGLIAEMYWNFWIPGVILGCFLIGFILKIMNQTILDNISNINMVIIYVSNFMFIGLSLIGSSFSSVLIGVLQTFIPLVLILNYIRKKNIYKIV